VLGGTEEGRKGEGKRREKGRKQVVTFLFQIAS
jgi:hypothetical protein